MQTKTQKALAFIVISPLIVGFVLGFAIGRIITIQETAPQAEILTESAETHISEAVIPVATKTLTAPIKAVKSEAEPEAPTIETQTYICTAYCPCEKCCGKWAKARPLDENGDPIVYTACGAVAKAGITIAVDPTIIPYGTTVLIDGNEYIAQDCGGAIKGNRIDIYFDDHDAALAFGVQTKEIIILEEAS